ncbi:MULTISPECIES: sensor histidine kinase [Clostridium]|uniref:histidine kinase n=2 Tax=Clostridium TaxID=1485 RepID=D8GUD2_CLOLD|nr:MULTISPECIES: HAMP domain-containing sensor histidine kinase [Clostridium]ADK14795.1 predicted two component sensor histidine kinase [Clostridium ljungdahlii DSM 13528]AGY78046.1 HAMP domain-containing histidine kinase [Clostridium autoethanogenum DSM 10061]ALU38180.1 Integral membrane sensor signal transduction histidine kinase [Clostridium autoethanogenum DSM 10061]OAA85996.1 Signal transduction histidine-protein kinase ArlS [Clostridium ljungdahlii DSM 13528]OVY50944.1 Signal transductio
MSKIKLIFRIIVKIIKILFLLLERALKILPKYLSRAVESIENKLRFSISFKITVTYVFTFVIIFFFITLGIIGSFNYYMQNSRKDNYIVVLLEILAVWNIIGLIIIIIIGSKASKKFLSPVYTMADTVKKISINALDKRLDIKGSKNELKDLAKTFNDMMDRIQSSIEKQNQFVSDASHELRTPISVIQGYANMLDRWGKDDKDVLEESIDAIKSESKSMKDLIEKLLFLARGDKNTQKVEKENFMMNELIDEIVKETKLIDDVHKIENEHNDEFSINADKKLIKEAIRIFIDNSIKYTEKGEGIKIDSYKREKEAIITIADNGTGISKEDLPHIFDRFYRADKSRTKSSGGTGLGLSISKWIIDKHNGKIHVWSEINIGTIVKITLPI